MMRNLIQRWAVVAGVLWTSGVHAASPARAQDVPSSAPGWRPEASVGIGLGHVFRFEDQSYGDRPTLSGGLAVSHDRGLALEIDASRPFGLSAGPAPCAIYADGAPLPCVGDGRNGVLSLQTISFGARYRFGRARVAPYVLAGLGVMRTRSVWSTAAVDGSHVVLTETERRDTGFGPDVGAGVDVRVSEHLSLRPEVRWLEASALSSLNLSIARLTVRTAYSW